MKTIGCAIGVGGCVMGAEEAPYFLKKNLKIPLEWDSIIEPDIGLENSLSLVVNVNQKLANRVYSHVQKNQRFLVFGGDHSCGIGTWSGVAEAKRSEGEIGLIWIDAHMDGHTFETSESKNIHGMSTAALLGQGHPQLTSILSKHPKIKPENLILIGCRSFEKGEADLLKNAGVKIYLMDEVKERGYLTVLNEAISLVTKDTVGFGVSFDLDVIDPVWVRAVGTPVAGGLTVSESLKGINLISRKPNLLGIEFVEYNPLKDNELETFKVLEDLAEACAIERVLA